MKISIYIYILEKIGIVSAPTKQLVAYIDNKTKISSWV